MPNLRSTSTRLSHWPAPLFQLPFTDPKTRINDTTISTPASKSVRTRLIRMWCVSSCHLQRWRRASTHDCVGMPAVNFTEHPNFRFSVRNAIPSWSRNRTWLRRDKSPKRFEDLSIEAKWSWNVSKMTMAHNQQRLTHEPTAIAAKKALKMPSQLSWDSQKCLAMVSEPRDGRRRKERW